VEGMLMLWFGFLETHKHTNIWNIFNTYSSLKYVKDYMSKYSEDIHWSNYVFFFFAMPIFL